MSISLLLFETVGNNRWSYNVASTIMLNEKWMVSTSRCRLDDFQS